MQTLQHRAPPSCKPRLPFQLHLSTPQGARYPLLQRTLSEGQVLPRLHASAWNVLYCGPLRLSQLHTLKVLTFSTLELTVFGERAFKEVIKVNYDHMGGS